MWSSIIIDLNLMVDVCNGVCIIVRLAYPNLRVLACFITIFCIISTFLK